MRAEHYESEFYESWALRMWILWELRHRPKEIVNSPGQLADDQVYLPSLLVEIKCNLPRLLPYVGGMKQISYFFFEWLVTEVLNSQISSISELCFDHIVWVLIAMFLWIIVGSIYWVLFGSCMNETKEPDPHLFWLLLSHTKLVQIFEDMRWSLPIYHRKSSFQRIKKLVWNEYYFCVRIMQFRHPLLFFIFLKY